MVGAAAALRLADPAGRGCVSRYEFEAMARRVARHVLPAEGGPPPPPVSKKQKQKQQKRQKQQQPADGADGFGIKPKELDELWKVLLCGEKGGAELDGQALLEALRPTGRLRRKAALFGKLVDHILLPAGVAAVLEDAAVGQTERAVSRPGQWVRAVAAQPYRANPFLDSEVVGKIGAGEAVQVVEAQEQVVAAHFLWKQKNKPRAAARARAFPPHASTPQSNRTALLSAATNALERGLRCLCRRLKVAGWLRLRCEAGWLSLRSAKYDRPLLAACDAPWQAGLGGDGLASPQSRRQTSATGGGPPSAAAAAAAAAGSFRSIPISGQFAVQDTAAVSDAAASSAHARCCFTAAASHAPAERAQAAAANRRGCAAPTGRSR